MPKLHLWDGGVYDNLGVEALYKVNATPNRFRDEINFLIVSDASAKLPLIPSVLIQRPKRLVSIAMDQVRSLRARSLFDHFKGSPNSGAYLCIGESASRILREAGCADADIGWIAEGCLSAQDVKAAASMKTHLRQLSEPDFDRLYRHGWEIADCVLRSRCSDLFP